METVVFSLGGSLIVPEQIDVDFLKKIKALMLDFISDGRRAVLICGGGKLCRVYNDAAKQIVEPKHDDLDWMGIAMTRVNAELVRTIFEDDAYEFIIKDPTKEIVTDKQIIVGGGYTPGNSSDKVAVMVAEKLGAKTVINMTNIDKVYSADPKEDPDATPLDSVSWDEFLGIIGEEWIPGKNVPFDPVASKLARDSGIEVIILNGKNLENLNSFLSGKEFVGTRIN